MKKLYIIKRLVYTNCNRIKKDIVYKTYDFEKAFNKLDDFIISDKSKIIINYPNASFPLVELSYTVDNMRFRYKGKNYIVIYIIDRG